MKKSALTALILCFFLGTSLAGSIWHISCQSPGCSYKIDFFMGRGKATPQEYRYHGYCFKCRQFPKVAVPWADRQQLIALEEQGKIPCPKCQANLKEVDEDTIPTFPCPKCGQKTLKKSPVSGRFD